jgi:hypothetical protein
MDPNSSLLDSGCPGCSAPVLVASRYVDNSGRCWHTDCGRRALASQRQYSPYGDRHCPGCAQLILAWTDVIEDVHGRWWDPECAERTLGRIASTRT